jgi:glycosyltransferase involved in cell wall biosynthesis
MDEPVSLVMAAYNRVHQARRSLTTIFRQNYPNLDVVFVDDGSTDGTPSLAQEFPIRYIRLEREGWCNMARTFNVGIKAAKHDILIMQSAEIMHLTHHSTTIIHQDTDEDRFAVLLGKTKPVPPTVKIEWREDGVSNVIRDLSTAVAADHRLWLMANVRAQTSEGGNHYVDYCSAVGSSRSRWPAAFFLSCLRRRWLMAIRGFDEDYVKAGHDDDDLALRLIHYVGLRQDFTDDIRGEHQWHPSSPFKNENEAMFEKKKLQMARKLLSPVRNEGRPWGVV